MASKESSERTKHTEVETKLARNFNDQLTIFLSFVTPIGQEHQKESD